MVILPYNKGLKILILSDLIKFSASFKDYERLAEQYILSLSEPVAKRITNIERSMRIFIEFVYGYLPAAGEIKWPVLKPNYDTSASEAQLIPFNEAYSYNITDKIVHFYIADYLFMRIFRNPEKYISFLKSCRGVIGPDMSQYTDMPAEMRYWHAWCNAYMSSLLQQAGVNLYYNVTWSKADSYPYSCPSNLAGSAIAINSNAVHCNDLALYRWRCGYSYVVKTLHPSHIIRYGQPVEGELTDISSYHVNERLKLLRDGSKRK